MVKLSFVNSALVVCLQIELQFVKKNLLINFFTHTKLDNFQGGGLQRTGWSFPLAAGAEGAADAACSNAEFNT